MRSRLEIVSKLVEDRHITFEEGLMLMEEVKHPLNNFPQHRSADIPLGEKPDYPYIAPLGAPCFIKSDSLYR